MTSVETTKTKTTHNTKVAPIQ